MLLLSWLAMVGPEEPFSLGACCVCVERCTGQLLQSEHNGKMFWVFDSKCNCNRAVESEVAFSLI